MHLKQRCIWSKRWYSFYEHIICCKIADV